MQTTVRALLIGILAGAALFFVPFLFRFLLIALFVGFIIRLVTGFGWRRRFAANRYYDACYEGNWNENEIVSIDGNRYIAPVNKTGPGNQVAVQ